MQLNITEFDINDLAYQTIFGFEHRIKENINIKLDIDDENAWYLQIKIK